MSDAQREQLTAILDDIYAGFTQGIAASRGKSADEVAGPPPFTPTWSDGAIVARLSTTAK